MTDTNDKPMYGVWIPLKGWLRGASTFADYDYQKAKQVSKLIGQNSSVRFIDKSIEDLEHQYLEQEGKSKWHIFKNWLRNKLKLSINSK